jgi:DNA-binding response OmpR family regulator
VEFACRNRLAAHAEAIIVDMSECGRAAAQVVRRLRQARIDRPLIVLSPPCDWRERIDNLEAGADDHITMPFRSEEIVARLHAVIRRRAGSATDRMAAGNLELDLRTSSAWLDGECLNLTRNEFRLLRLFLLRADHTMSQQEIWSHLNEDASTCSTNAVEVQIARLRRKVGRTRIRTLRGTGYRYVAEDAPETGVARSD